MVGDGGLAVLDDLLMEGDQRIRIGTAAAAVVKQFMEPGVQVFDLMREPRTSDYVI